MNNLHKLMSEKEHWLEKCQKTNWSNFHFIRMFNAARIHAVSPPIIIPSPPNTTASRAVSAKNIRLMKLFLAPIARIIPISDVRSIAAMLKVFIIIIAATKKMNSTKTNNAPCVIVAN